MGSILFLPAIKEVFYISSIKRFWIWIFGLRNVSYTRAQKAFPVFYDENFEIF
jgi:hypothetical protein